MGFDWTLIVKGIGVIFGGAVIAMIWLLGLWATQRTYYWANGGEVDHPNGWRNYVTWAAAMVVFLIGLSITDWFYNAWFVDVLKVANPKNLFAYAAFFRAVAFVIGAVVMVIIAVRGLMLSHLVFLNLNEDRAWTNPWWRNFTSAFVAGLIIFVSFALIDGFHWLWFKQLLHLGIF